MTESNQTMRLKMFVNESDWPFIAFCSFLFMVGMILGVKAEKFATHEFKKEAVKNNAARWVVDQDGNVKFEWNAPIGK